MKERKKKEREQKKRSVFALELQMFENNKLKPMDGVCQDLSLTGGFNS